MSACTPQTNLQGIFSGYVLVRSEKHNQRIGYHLPLETRSYPCSLCRSRRRVAYPISNITGVPYILTIHCGDVPDAAPEKTAKWFRMINPFSKAIWMNATRVIAVSEYVKELAEKRYDVPIQAIGNGINLTQFAPMKNFWKFQTLKPIYPNPLRASMIFYIACGENAWNGK
ncbi:MAG: glycosyltransferase [Anaerolineaceae bacterium]